MRYLFFCLVSFMVMSQSHAQPLPASTLESIVTVEAYDNDIGLLRPQSGSGSIISANGYIVTNFHVIANDYDEPYPYHAILMSNPDDISQAPEHRYWARYVVGSPDYDLALLEIISQVDGSDVTQVFNGVPLGNASGLRLGETLRIVGYPGIGGDTLTLTSGYFSGWLGEDFESSGRAWIKTDSQVSGGNSGGAAFAVDNSLIGIPTIVSSGRDGEYQAYLRPINFIFPLLESLRADLPGLLLPSNIRDVYGNEATLDETRWHYPDPDAPQSALRLLNSATGSQSYGALALNSDVDNILAGREPEDDIMYHDYVLELPQNFNQRLFIYLDGRERDADMAIRFNHAIRDTDKSDYSDISTELTSFFVLESDELRDVETVHIRVLNYYDVPLPYNLRVSTKPFSAYDSDFLEKTRPSGVYGLITLEDTISGSIAPAPENALIYHSYALAIDESVEAFSVRVSGSDDIDLAVNANSIIEDYYEADFFDDSDAPEAEYRIDYPTSGIYYIDIVNLINETIDYTLELAVHEADATSGASSEDDSANGVAEGGLGFVKMLSAGETAEGRVRGYDDGAGYQFFTIDVPEGTKEMKILLEAEGDLDMAINHGAELEDYTLPEDGGAMDAYDFEPSNDARITVRDPEAGTWYIDVINLNGASTAIPYTIRVALK